MPDSFKVMRAFERHDGTALRKYHRGRILTAKEAGKIPEKTWDSLVGSGCINRIVEDKIIREPAQPTIAQPAEPKTAPSEVG